MIEFYDIKTQIIFCTFHLIQMKKWHSSKTVYVKRVRENGPFKAQTAILAFSEPVAHYSFTFARPVKHRVIFHKN
jgi:hypothetical protein